MTHRLTANTRIASGMADWYWLCCVGVADLCDQCLPRGGCDCNHHTAAVMSSAPPVRRCRVPCCAAPACGRGHPHYCKHCRTRDVTHFSSDCPKLEAAVLNDQVPMVDLCTPEKVTKKARVDPLSCRPQHPALRQLGAGEIAAGIDEVRPYAVVPAADTPLAKHFCCCKLAELGGIELEEAWDCLSKNGFDMAMALIQLCIVITPAVDWEHVTVKSDNFECMDWKLALQKERRN